ncbi:MAG: hypothetical protein A3F35_00035 [Candidatus Woykebacteria bacterium RIFCSPHIGHO2_12_FULL_45_10]|uniref:Uncharacterized protein n=1 Tax=Candidatus Woykebacteria bacterium RIFCSPHIGHO2_12_FULL_45_10 TaxID=1802603 RepID=A0A1G1WR21_9BACT|nr:MAG: hypothetical protein A3F35_00035 [Candidatus Woykebacteria bacterium RIFCSPHIGHO2_12_FULL_45_10]
MRPVLTEIVEVQPDALVESHVIFDDGSRIITRGAVNKEWEGLTVVVWGNYCSADSIDEVKVTKAGNVRFIRTLHGQHFGTEGMLVPKAFLEVCGR